MPQRRSKARPESTRQEAKISAPRRGGGPRALADSLRKVTHQALGQRSLAEQSLILDWPSIAGDDVARTCLPQGITFERRDRRMDGTLILKVRSGEATRLQHMEPQLIERINGYLGYRAVARLRLHQGAHPSSAARPDPNRDRDRDPGTAAESDAENGSDQIGDPALRSALARLGRTFKGPS